MRRQCPVSGIALVLLATSLTLNAFQTKQSDPKPDLKVTIIPEQRTFAIERWRPLPTRIQLENIGNSPVYLPRLIGRRGGGRPGFWVSLLKLNGESAQGCGYGSFTDYFQDERPLQQALQEDYLILQPRALIGWVEYLSCVPEAPGQYQLVGGYDPTGLQSTERIMKDPELKKTLLVPLVCEKIDAEPVTIRMTAMPKRRKKK